MDSDSGFAKIVPENMFASYGSHLQLPLVVAIGDWTFFLYNFEQNIHICCNEREENEFI